ncbi:MAG: response regulator [Chloroflexi bacterium]|nr:response regulator [Chloroflexota bacterium]
MIRVAYVEDEPAIAELLRSGLDLFGMEVNPIYGDGNEAYNAIIGGDPLIAECDVLIIDIRLPGGMTGLELGAKLREAGEARPILIVSAYQPPARSELEAINAHFMPKPFDFAGIVQKIQNLLG